MPASVSVRMYDVGFGDAFLVTVRDEQATWRMLVDCGQHMHSDGERIGDVVTGLVADLAAESDDGVPRLDVVVATHRHSDHISGFAEPAWEAVHVDQVWLPFSEDPDDPDTQRLGVSHRAAADALVALIADRTFGLDPGAWPTELALARTFAFNVRSNAEAMDRLLGRNGRRFATTPTVHYLPHRDPSVEVRAVTAAGAAVHVLGPPRTAEHLKTMEPPKSVRWLEAGGRGSGSAPFPLFNASFVVEEEDELPADLLAAKSSLHLHKLDDDAEVLAAASVLERAVNNTSLFLVLEAGPLRLLFPGDAQQGAWDHVLDDPARRALLTGLDFYKIGHHGSHNATPRRFVEEVLPDGAWTMLPWGLVKRWRDTIPKAELMDALAARGAHVVRADEPLPHDDGVTTAADDTGRWREITFLLPA